MSRHIWTVFCSISSIDRESNNVSLLEVIEQVSIAAPLPEAELGLIPLRSSLVTLWARSNPDIEERALGRTVLRGPSGRELGSWTFEIDLRTHPRSRSRNNFTAVMVEGVGIHEWEVYQAPDQEPDAWEMVASVPLQMLADEDIAGTDEDE